MSQVKPGVGDAPAAEHPEQTAHNLESRDPAGAAETPPVRDAGEADFGAEAHGFTGYEAAGKGADYHSSESPAESFFARLRRLFRA